MLQIWGYNMNALKDIIAYILESYPFKDELSNARVTKIIYLTDWYNSINNNEQISNIQWVYDNYGPFVWNIKEEVENNSDIFKMEKTTNAFGGEKLLLSMADTNYSPDLNDKARKALDHIIKKTKDLSWSNFIKVVYSTYPISSSERYSRLDLVTKAKEYKKTFK